METSILKSMKKVLGIPEDDDAFDETLLIHINSTFATLHHLGVGPDDAFFIEDDTAVWSAFIEGPEYNSVKTYVGLKLRVLFDPPESSFGITAMEKQITEFEWRLNQVRELTKWVDPATL